MPEAFIENNCIVMDEIRSYDVSVIVLTYNPDWDELKSTLNSIIGQEGCNFEIIVSDDGSVTDISNQLKIFFNQNAFDAFKLIRNIENKGTVKNLRTALEYCEAEFVKDIGQGDILYNENVLSRMLQCLRKGNYGLICGNAVPMVKEHRVVRVFPYGTIQCSSGDREREIGWECFVKNEYPHGATFIYRKDIYSTYLDELLDRVIYCDDITARLMILDKERVAFLPEHIAFYEFKCGISNTVGGMQLVAEDTDNFEKYFLKRLETCSFKGTEHLRRIIQLRQVKRQSHNGRERSHAAFLLMVSDIRIPVNWLTNRFHKRKLKNIDIRCAEKWIGCKCIIGEKESENH